MCRATHPSTSCPSAGLVSFRRLPFLPPVGLSGGCPVSSHHTLSLMALDSATSVQSWMSELDIRRHLTESRTRGLTHTGERLAVQTDIVGGILAKCLILRSLNFFNITPENCYFQSGSTLKKKPALEGHWKPDGSATPIVTSSLRFGAGVESGETLNS